MKTDNQILVGIHVQRRGEIGPFSKKYIQVLDFNQISWIQLDINDIDFWEKVKQCTHFIYHWGGSPDHHQIARSIMPVIENTLKIPIFPNFQTAWHHDDKLRQYYLLENRGYPIIDSWIFWDKSKALQR